MANQFRHLEYVREYIDDLLVTTNGSYQQHLRDLEVVFQRLQGAGLKVNATKSLFSQQEVEYLGYLITREGIKPQPKKIAAIQNMAPPKTRRQLRSFLGLVNYYRDMTKRHSEIIAPLTKMTSNKIHFKWTKVEQQAFETIKLAISKETLLSYPDFSKTFEIHTDASLTQLGAVLSQEGKPIAFYSRKLTSPQQKYTTTERELLAIVETLKEFRNILLGQKIIVHTDHKNLTQKNFNTDRVIRWRLIMEEYGPELKYIQGEKNVVADALSRLDLGESPAFSSKTEQINFYHEEIFNNLHEYPEDVMPIEFGYIQAHQKEDPELQEKLKDDKYKLHTFHGAGKTYELICKDNKIVIPNSLKQKVMDWYHTILVHPGRDRTEKTISQHFYWKGMHSDIEKFCKLCPTCQKTKQKLVKYGHLPAKLAEAIP